MPSPFLAGMRNSGDSLLNSVSVASGEISKLLPELIESREIVVCTVLTE